MQQRAQDGKPLAPHDEPAGEFWPWAPYLTAADVERFRTDLVAMVETLADVEQWPDEHREDVLTRAIRGPLADLLPNLHHFNERLTEARAAVAAQETAARRAWRFDR
jgi:hypothetical protein